MFLNFKHFISWVFFSLVIFITFESDLFAVEYRRYDRPNGTVYYRMDSMTTFVPVHPSVIPTNCTWRYRQDPPLPGHEGNYWFIWTEHPDGPSAAQQQAQAMQRQAEVAHQAEIARQNETKRQIELARVSQLTHQRDLAAKTAELYREQIAETQAREAERQADRDKKFTQLKTDIDARVARTKAMSEAFCFPGDTLISVKSESSRGYLSKPISSIRIGDFVVSCNLEVEDGICEFSQVQEVIERTTNRLFKFTLGDKILRATENHPFYVVEQKKWVEAQDLRSEDRLQSILGEVVTIDHIEIEEDNFKVYNLEVEKNHNYYACDVLVHNCKNLAAAGTMSAVAGGSVVGAAGLLGPAAFVGSAAVLGYGLHKATEGVFNNVFQDQAEPTDLGAHDSAGQEAVTKIEKIRKAVGGDGAESKHVIEKVGDKVTSKQHVVTKDSKVIHQHQDHIGQSGTVRRFPDEWTGSETINAPELPKTLPKFGPKQ